MLRVEVKKEISLSADEAWAIVDDFGAIQNFHPLVRESGILYGSSTGEGAERFCDFGDGNRIEEKITDYQPGESMSVVITDPGKFPLREAEAKLSVRPTGADRCEVSFLFDFRPRFGPIGWLVGRSVMVPKFRRLLGSVIDGLETYGRSGVIQGKGPLKQAS